MDIEHAVMLRIKKLCQENNITINALSIKAGMPRSTIKNIIYGTSKNTGIVTIQLMCDAFGISIKEFFNDDLFEEIEMIKD